MWDLPKHVDGRVPEVVAHGSGARIVSDPSTLYGQADVVLKGDHGTGIVELVDLEPLVRLEPELEPDGDAARPDGRRRRSARSRRRER